MKPLVKVTHTNKRSQTARAAYEQAVLEALAAGHTFREVAEAAGNRSTSTIQAIKVKHERKGNGN